MAYCMYLRKSRADAEAERRGIGETLARHHDALDRLASQMGIMISAVYQEVVSGESIASRPEMMRLLSDVEQGAWDGVLVMEVERLARGNTADQGIVAQTFKYSNTLIITPQKTYNPNDPIDEEYFEFSLFMSRREYKAINRRLEQGRLASLRNGLWIYNKAPYGYDIAKCKEGKGYILVPNPIEAPVVEMISDWYYVGITTSDGTLQRLGSTRIAHRLMDMGIEPPEGPVWRADQICRILRSIVYAGKIHYKRRAAQKVIYNGKVYITRKRSKDYEVFDGKHQPIITMERYLLTQDLLDGRRPVLPPIPPKYRQVNPLAGLIVCSKCGHKLRMQRSNTGVIMHCTYEGCDAGSATLKAIEDSILDALRGWLAQYTLQGPAQVPDTTDSAIESTRKAIAAAQNKLEASERQMARTHELLELDVYDIDTFRARVQAIKQQQEALSTTIANAEGEIARIEAERKLQAEIVPSVQRVLDVYESTEDVAAKNAMLKEVIDYVDYTKERGGNRWHQKEMTLRLYMRLPAVKPNK